MLKKILLGFAVLVLLAVMFVGWRVWPIYELAQEISPHTAPEDYAKQDDSRVPIPATRELVPRSFDPMKNAYWGELHVHTTESMDSVLFGTTATIEDAYRFARGEPLRSAGGELMQLSRPLDFMAITDHAESFGWGTRCAEPDLRLAARAMCGFIRTPGFPTAVFLQLRQITMAVEPDPTQPAGVYRRRPRDRQLLEDNPICAGEGGLEQCLRAGRSDWARYIELADRHYEPGVFTTFAAYEFSPMVEGAGKHHRNVIFNGDDLPAQAISSQDVGSAVELWRGLEETCTGRCDFLTIPHNMNKGWGLFYSRHTWD
ncbi:MAG: DUF3604 domain-containing protein, partial [Myxococcales bacterium]|nr:DUF3604 domain-containing protein [Myxococcales bacterium]